MSKHFCRPAAAVGVAPTRRNEENKGAREQGNKNRRAGEWENKNKE
jgi:hypothetical protein